MRATLGYILALALAATPALARANGPADNGPAAGSDSSTSAKSEPAAKPDTATTESELEELRSLLESQASQLQDQNDQLKATQDRILALEKELKAANAAPAVTSAASTAAARTPAASAASNSGMPTAKPASSSSSSSAAPQALPAARGVTTASLDNTYSLPPTYGTNPALPEPQATSPLSFRIGAAEFTPGGFADLTDVFRTVANGGSIGSSFGSIYYNIPGNYPLAGSTENHFSEQNSRISLRVDSTVAGGKVVGYLETDFLGNAAAGLATTSNSDTLRMRLYFIDYTRGHFEFLAGQNWSMFVSNRNGIGFMPGDVFYSQDMDTNYQLGLLWERTPQFRFVYHANSDFAMGVSIENSDQYIGSGYTLPSPLTTSSAVVGQFDPITATPNTPAVLPDIVAKIAYDHMINGHHIHIEGVGDFRTFRLENFTSSGNTVTSSSSNKVEGAVGAINSNWEIFKNFRLIENVDWGSGDGRLIANTSVPDFIVRPVTPGSATGPYTLSPLHAGAFIGGFEWQATPKWLFYGYDGGVYISKDTGFVGAAQYGWGIETATATTAEAQNRFLQEATFGIILTMWRNPQYGALQLITQGSYLQRSPWVVVTGSPSVAHNTMAWADVRYTLP